jgi:hypothetical protein
MSYGAARSLLYADKFTAISPAITECARNQRKSERQEKSRSADESHESRFCINKRIKAFYVPQAINSTLSNSRMSIVGCGRGLDKHVANSSKEMPLNFPLISSSAAIPANALGPEQPNKQLSCVTRSFEVYCAVLFL